MLIISNYFQIFLFGICIGSFLNVVVYRLQNDLSIITPRSFCPKCKKKLTIRENIPLISYLFQRGKCLNCNAYISFRYPFIELITGVLFVVFVYSSPTLYSSNINLSFVNFFSWLFLSILICITLIDIESFWVPQSLINFGFFSGIFGLISNSFINNQVFDFYSIAKGLSASFIAFLIFESVRYLAKYIFKKEALGKGDSKLVAMIALWLGPLGTLIAVGISYICAAIFCLFGISTSLIKYRQVIPFAPFLSLGGLLTWFFGNEFIIKMIYRM